MERPDIDERRWSLRAYFGCLASALGFLHDNSIRHKDIKPQNILIKNNEPCFTDFGLAVDWTEIGHSTTLGPTAMTPRYSAPEVAACEPRNTSSDTWSLGCVFLEVWAVLKGASSKDLLAFTTIDGQLLPYHSRGVQISSLLNRIKALPGTAADSLQSLWIKNMLQREHRERWSMQSVLESILEHGADPCTRYLYIGRCCIDDQESAESVSSYASAEKHEQHIRDGSPSEGTSTAQVTWIVTPPHIIERNSTSQVLCPDEPTSNISPARETRIAFRSGVPKDPRNSSFLQRSYSNTSTRSQPYQVQASDRHDGDSSLCRSAPGSQKETSEYDTIRHDAGYGASQERRDTSHSKDGRFGIESHPSIVDIVRSLARCDGAPHIKTLEVKPNRTDGMTWSPEAKHLLRPLNPKPTYAIDYSRSSRHARHDSQNASARRSFVDMVGDIFRPKQSNEQPAKARRRRKRTIQRDSTARKTEENFDHFNDGEEDIVACDETVPVYDRWQVPVVLSKGRRGFGRTATYVY